MKKESGERRTAEVMQTLKSCEQLGLGSAGQVHVVVVRAKWEYLRKSDKFF